MAKSFLRKKLTPKVYILIFENIKRLHINLSTSVKFLNDLSLLWIGETSFSIP